MVCPFVCLRNSKNRKVFFLASHFVPAAMSANTKGKTVSDKIKIAVNKALNSDIVQRYVRTVNRFVRYTWKFGTFIGVTTWTVASILCITAVPFFLELERDQLASEAERRQTDMLRRRGYSELQINRLKNSNVLQ
ncbi:uncharacterized protein [Blastocystis hominis]|uniref:Mitochondrial import receptor subunit TOM22 n=1 Tax=Blastocystis hominis TaxID=12968 RepID=D8MAV4_BLAHO|nr:uncharacterized protein [Blastocystis hominis]CBK25193.2 unnamed protein product [Blastocystis hominis]|eukprot:XP_012899241.1 uncharacterized protein [Blastocystis hominis]